MNVLESTPLVDLPDRRVAVCGDWHGNTAWLRRVASTIARRALDVRTILHAGDWWMDTRLCDEILAEAGIERVYVTLGNHEPWGEIVPLLDAHPGQAVRISATTWILPRPARMRIGERSILSLGGAISVDRSRRTEGVDWWADEEITDAHVDTAIEGGPADIMITHESPAGSPVRAVHEALHTNLLRLSRDVRGDSAESRMRVGRVWDAVRPALLLHGHIHEPGGGVAADGRRVISLGCDGQPGNIAFLSLDTLAVDVPSLHDVRTL